MLICLLRAAMLRHATTLCQPNATPTLYVTTYRRHELRLLQLLITPLRCYRATARYYATLQQRAARYFILMPARSHAADAALRFAFATPGVI